MRLLRYQRSARLIRKVDDVSGLYVNVHRHLRVGRWFDACDGQNVLRCVQADVFGPRIEQFQDASRCPKCAIGDGFACTALSKHPYVDLPQFSRHIRRIEVCAFTRGLLVLAGTGDEPVYDLTDLGRNALRFDRNGVVCVTDCRNCIHAVQVTRGRGGSQRTWAVPCIYR